MTSNAAHSSARYRIDQFHTSQLDRIELPKFQRGFVWSNSKQNDFVQTLHEGYPFGTLLVYPENNEPDSPMKLLDGQQRLSTIKKYIKNPLSFWKPLNRDIYQQAFTQAAALMDNSETQLSEKEFDDSIMKSVDGQSRSLLDWILTAKLEIEDQTKLLDIVDEIANQVKGYVNLDTLQIPMIVYEGDRSTIADVFANLNKGGVPLSKYEVFGAAWVDDKFKLETTELQNIILQYVKQYYIDMQNNSEFEISNFSEDDFTQTRTISLAEFGRALGQFIADRLPSLVSSASSQEIGFGLLGIFAKINNRELGKLNKYTGQVEENIERILQRADRISKNLDSMFSKLLLRFKDTGNSYEGGLNATFKTLSYFAALWNLEPSSEEYRIMLHNIKAYYVYDFVTGVWGSHGDQRLDEFTQGKRNYIKPVLKEEFRKAFTRWINEETTPGINFSKNVKALISIHANLSYLSAAVPDGETFELEHIIPRKRINAVDSSKRRVVLGGSMGNCMYLPKSLNNSKKAKTLYDVNKYDQYSQLIEQSDYFTREDFEEIFKALDDHQFDIVNSKLREREMKVAAKIIDGLCD